MFAKLKKKIQEEAQNVVGGAEADKRVGRASAGPGLASPISKDYPGEDQSSPSKLSRGPIFNPGRRGSNDSASPVPGRMGSRTSSVDDIAKESSSKEEVLAMLMRRTEQVKKLEIKVSELAAMIKDKNKFIDKLESAMERQQHEFQQQLSEMTEKYNSEKRKVSEGFRQAVDHKEQEIRQGVMKEITALEKSKSDLEARLHKAEQYRDRYYKTEEANDEFQGLASQELAKLKHMLLNSQAELKERTENLTSTEKLLSDRDSEIKSLMQQIALLASKSEEGEDINKSLTRSLDETQKSLREAESNLRDITVQLDQSCQELSKAQSSHTDLQNSHQSLLRDIELLKQQNRAQVDTKSEQISHLQERVNTLEQRLQSGELTEDERVKALQTERDDLEKKLMETRQQLTESKSSSAHNVALLEQRISELNARLTEAADDKTKLEKSEQNTRNNLQKEVDSWKSKLQMALLEVKDKEKLLDLQKQTQEAELVRHQKTLSQLEESYKEQLRQLRVQLDLLERTRDREKQVAQEKITKLESGQEDWLEREIDTERQITRLEEDLYKTKVETTEKEKEIISLKRQLSLKQTALDEADNKSKKQDENLKQQQNSSETYESKISSLQKELRTCHKERDDLLVRNATLFQEFESHKRKSGERVKDLGHEVMLREAAVAGLETSLQELQQETLQYQEKIRALQSSKEAALDKMESEEIMRLKKRLNEAEDQLADKNKNIKMLQQRLTDLKKTLQRELKVQALPNDDPTGRLTPSGKDVNHLSPANSSSNLQAYGSSVENGKVDHSAPPSIPVSAQSHTNSHVSHSRVTNSVYMRPYPPDVYNSSTGVPTFPTGGQHPGSGRSSSQRNRNHANIHYDFNEDTNFKYLKHVVLKFMLSRESEAVHLIKAVSMLLHFSPDEQRLIRDTLDWKMSWFGTKPEQGSGQLAKVVPSAY